MTQNGVAKELFVRMPLKPAGTVKEGFETTTEDVVYCDDILDVDEMEVAALKATGCTVFEGPWCELYYLQEDPEKPGAFNLLRLTDTGFEWVVDLQQDDE